MSEVLDNPFAIRPRNRRRPLLASLKGWLVVAALLVVVVVIQSQTRQWLLHRWASGFAELPVEAQIQRLLQIDSLGDLATETLTRRIAATDEQVASKAFDLVRQRQTAWSTRDDDALARAHGSMVDGLAGIVDDLPATRASWVTQLLNHTILECVDQRGPRMQQTYAAANALAIRFAGGDTVLTDRPAGADNGNLPPPSLVPLPVRLQSLSDIQQSPLASAPMRTESPVVASPETPQVRVTRPDVKPAIVAPSVGEADARPPENSLQAVDTKGVIGLLASKQAAVHDQAVAELARRGLSKEEIRVANQLAAPQVEVRLGLLDSIVRRTDIDPRPWLLWLAEDADREVRLRAIAALAATNDAAVTHTLQKRLNVESDPDVIAQIQKAIGRR